MKDKFIKTSAIIALSLLFVSDPGHGKQDYTCDEIHTNYINAVEQFASVVQSMDTGGKLKKDFPQYEKALKNAFDTINDKKNYTYPTLTVLFDAIQKSSPIPSNVILAPLETQVQSSHTRVDEWKASNDNDPHKQPCREKWGCDLGQEGTKCGK